MMNMNIEFVQEELIYIFDCVSSATNNATTRLQNTMNYIHSSPETFIALRGKIDRDLTGVEQGTELMQMFIEYLKDMDEYEDYRELLIEKQEQNEKCRQGLEEVCKAIDSSVDDA